MTDVTATSTSTLVRCRRCKRTYDLDHAARLPACPHCGAAPVALWKRLARRHNGVAAVLCVVGLVTLSAADVMPFISMSKLGEVRIFSLIGGVMELFERGNPVIGTVLLVFSVIFPFAKLLALLAATSSIARLSAQQRKRLHHLAVFTGKYSLLDILVVAIMIVLVKFDGIAEVKALSGTILFCIAIVISIAAGMLVDLRDVEETT